MTFYDGESLDELAFFDTSGFSSVAHRDGTWLVNRVEAEPQDQLVAWPAMGSAGG